MSKCLSLCLLLFVVVTLAFDCSRDGLYPDPTNVHTFYKCTSGISTLEYCLPTQFFDPYLKICRALPHMHRRDVENLPDNDKLIAMSTAFCSACINKSSKHRRDIVGLGKVIGDKIHEDLDKLRNQHDNWLKNFKKIITNGEAAITKKDCDEPTTQSTTTKA